MSDSLIRGFSDAVQESQQVFRLVMKAMSEPGVVVEVSELEQMAPINHASYACILALLDQSTPLWLTPEFNHADIKQNLHFHTGVPLAENSFQADFVLGFAGEIGDLDWFQKGSAEYPETGATLILHVNQINTGSGSELSLSGPGIPDQRALTIDGLSPALLDYLCERPDEFPCGVDMIFCCDQQLVCIPRSTVVTASFPADNKELA